MLFTRLNIRVARIEVIENLNTSSFMNAWRSFLATIRTIKQICSDRSTNIIGACVSPQDSDHSLLKKFLSERGCTWVFNLPLSFHMGGVCESMMCIARQILYSMLLQRYHHRLTHQILTTFMAEVSAIINARPLVPASADSETPVILTPAAILTQKLGKTASTLKDIAI